MVNTVHVYIYFFHPKILKRLRDITPRSLRVIVNVLIYGEHIFLTCNIYNLYPIKVCPANGIQEGLLPPEGALSGGRLELWHGQDDSYAGHQGEQE